MGEGTSSVFDVFDRCIPDRVIDPYVGLLQSIAFANVLHKPVGEHSHLPDFCDIMIHNCIMQD